MAGGSKPMVPFWGRCTTHFRTYFSGDWDVHWRYGILTHGGMAGILSGLDPGRFSKGFSILIAPKRWPKPGEKDSVLWCPFSGITVQAQNCTVPYTFLSGTKFLVSINLFLSQGTNRDHFLFNGSWRA